MAPAPPDEGFTPREQLQNARDAGYWPKSKFYGPKSYDNDSRTCAEANVASMAHIYQWQKHRLVVFCQHHNLPIDDLKQLGEQELNKLVDYVYPWQVEKSENHYKDFRAKLVRVGAERGEMYMEMSGKGQFANERMKYPDPEYCDRIKNDLDELYNERRETIPATLHDSNSPITSDVKQPILKTSVPNAPGHHLRTSGQLPRMPQADDTSSKQLKRKSGQQHLGQGQPTFDRELDNNVTTQQAVSSHQTGSSTQQSALNGQRQTMTAPSPDRRPRTEDFGNSAGYQPAQMQHRGPIPTMPAPGNGQHPAPSAQSKSQGAQIIDPEQARRRLQEQQRYSDPHADESLDFMHRQYNRSQLDLIDYGPPPPPAALAPPTTLSSNSLRSRGSVKTESHHPGNDAQEDHAEIERAATDRVIKNFREDQQFKADEGVMGQNPVTPPQPETHSIKTFTEVTGSPLAQLKVQPMVHSPQHIKEEKKKEKKSKKDRKHDQTDAQTTTVTIPRIASTTDSDSSEAGDQTQQLLVRNDAAMQMLAKNMLTMNLDEIKMPPPPGYESKDKTGKNFKKAKGKKKALDPADPEAMEDLVRDLGAVWISKGKGDTPEQEVEDTKKKEGKGKGKGKGEAQ